MKRACVALMPLAISACGEAPFVCSALEDDAAATAMVQVRKRFRDPDAVRFQLAAGRMESENPCVWIVAGRGAASNAFGGRGSFAWQARVTYVAPPDRWRTKVTDIIVKE